MRVLPGYSGIDGIIWLNRYNHTISDPYFEDTYSLTVILARCVFNNITKVFWAIRTHLNALIKGCPAPQNINPAVRNKLFVFRNPEL
jgi:hypothetical protein